MICGYILLYMNKIKLKIELNSSTEHKTNKF
jgi:hypothetical protein